MSDYLLPSILRIARLHRNRRATALAEIGLHPGQDSVLLLIQRGGPCTMTEIAHSLAVRPPTVTKIVGRLVAGGLVARQGVRGDLRKAAIDLTEAGRQRAADVATIWTRLEKKALAEISAGPACADLLRRIETNLASPGRAPAEPL